MFKTPVITYNLKERGRQYRGVERSFNIPAIVQAVNSPACQERVKTRGMLGYYGHWPRLRFGMEPAEGGIAEGKAQAVEPALVTTLLRAHDDGTIEHQAEFLDTSAGQLCARMFNSRVGGFSSAIDPRKPELYGFDWVNDPNYSTNRGYELVLDSVTAGHMTLDDIVAAEYAEQTAGMNALFERMEAVNRLALDSAERLRLENIELMDLLAARQPKATADLVAGADRGAAEQLKRDRQFFLDSAILPVFQRPKDAEERDAEAEYSRLLGRVTRV